MTAAQWRAVGRDLAARYAAHAPEYAAVGYASGDAYRIAFVRQCWPNASPNIRRHIREGWREVPGA